MKQTFAEEVGTVIYGYSLLFELIMALIGIVLLVLVCFGVVGWKALVLAAAVAFGVPMLAYAIAAVVVIRHELNTYKKKEDEEASQG